MSKKPINEFGKVFDYLLKPDLRTQETQDSPIVIEDASFAAASFRDLVWRNIRFVNCDFSGEYRVALSGLKHCVFERCNFSGVVLFGDTEAVTFAKCTGYGKLFLLGGKRSKNVLFEQCEFTGSPDFGRNNFATLGTFGEAAFEYCKFKYVTLSGDQKLMVKNCECHEISLPQVKDYGGSVALIEDCQFSGEANLGAGSFKSLILRNCKFDRFDMNDATVEGAILVENVEAKSMKFYVKKAGSLTVRKVRVFGDGRVVFEAYVAAIKDILIEQSEFWDNGEAVTIAGGFSLKNPERISHVNQSVVFKDVTIGNLDSGYVNSPLYRMENCTLKQAAFGQSRIGKLTARNTKINKSLDFTGTQATEQDLAGLSGAALSVAKLDGSNIRLPR